MKNTLLIVSIIALIVFHFITIANAQTTFQNKFTGFYSSPIADGKPTADGGYILCGDIVHGLGEIPSFLVKLNNHGDTVWTKTYNGGDEATSASGVQQTFDGGYVMAGSIFGSMAPGQNYVIKTDSVGNILWTWSNFNWDGPGISSISQTLDSGYIVSGYNFQDYSYLIKLDKNGALSWNKVFTKPVDYFQSRVIKTVKQTADSGFILCGSYNDSSIYNYSDSALYHDIYLIKTNAQGDTMWTKRFTANGYANYNNEGADAIQTADGGYMLTGSTLSADNYWHLFAIKTNASGDTLWTKKYAPDTTHCYGYSVCATPDGGYLLAGACNASQQGNRIILIKINAYGDTLWTRNFGATDETGIAVHSTKDGGYFVAGYGERDSIRYNWNGYVVKTDSLGHSGCFEYNTILNVSSFPVMATSTYTIDTTFLTVDTIHFSVLTSSIIDSTICVSVGIDESIKPNISISLYPNPAGKYLQLAISNWLAMSRKYEVKIFNSLGEVCIQSEINNSKSEIDVSYLSQGIYLLQISIENRSWLGKFVKD